MNPKLVISNYFDSIVNQIDIYTEEKLEKTNENDLIQYKSNTVYMYKFEFWKTNHRANKQEQLDEYSINDFDFSHQPFRNKPSGSVKVKDFFNETREKLIAEVNAAQGEAFKRCDEIRDQLKEICKDESKTQEEREKEIQRKVFANKFFGLVRFTTQYGEGSYMYSPFKLLLVKLDYYIDLQEMLFSGYFFFQS